MNDENKKQMGPAGMVCWCSSVTRSDILVALNQGARTLDDIKSMTGACTLDRCKELNPAGT